MRKKWSLLAIVTMIMVLFCACSPEDKIGQPSESSKDKTSEKESSHQLKLAALEPGAYGNIEGLHLERGTYLSIIGKSAGGQFWDAVKEGAERAVKEMNEALGYEGEDKIKITYSGPSVENDVDEQVNILDEELARYPSAVSISVIDEKSCAVQFDLATENNIPIISFDSTNEYQGVMAKISTNNEEAARTAATSLAVSMENKGDILVLVHDSKSATARQRKEAFAEEIKQNYPDMAIKAEYALDDVEGVKKTIAEEINAGTYKKAGAAETPTNPGAEQTQGQTPQLTAANITEQEVIDYIFTKYPDIKGIYGTNSTAVMYAVNLCEKEEKKDIKIVGFDADNDQIKALEEGKIEGLVLQNPYAMGYASAVASARTILEMGNEAEIDSGYAWMTKEGLKDKEMRRLLY